MNDFYKVVDSLETKIERYLEMQEELKRTKLQLEAEIDDLKTKEIQYAKEIAQWKEKNQSLKLANSLDRKSTRLNSSHVRISYAVFCLKKKNKKKHSARLGSTK